MVDIDWGYLEFKICHWTNVVDMYLGSLNSESAYCLILC